MRSLESRRTLANRCYIQRKREIERDFFFAWGIAVMGDNSVSREKFMWLEEFTSCIDEGRELMSKRLSRHSLQGKCCIAAHGVATFLNHRCGQTKERQEVRKGKERPRFDSAYATANRSVSRFEYSYIVCINIINYLLVFFSSIY